MKLWSTIVSKISSIRNLKLITFDRFFFVLFSIFLSLRVFFINWIAGAEFLGSYFFLVSLSVPLSFIMGGAIEVNLISKFVRSEPTAILEDYICAQNSVIYFTTPVLLFGALWANSMVLYLLAMALANLSLVSCISISRTFSELKLTNATGIRFIFVFIFSLLGAKYDNIAIVILGDYFASLMIFKWLLAKKLNITFPKNFNPYSKFSFPYAANSLFQGVDKIVLGLFSSAAVGQLVLIQSFVSYGSYLNGLINNFLYTFRPKNLNFISSMFVLISIVCALFVLIFMRSLSFDLFIPIQIFLIFILSALNFAEYESNAIGVPFAVVWQTMIQIISFLMIIFIVGFDSYQKLIVATLFSVTMKYFHFLVIKRTKDV